MRDQLMHGYHNEQLQEKLFGNAELKFDQATGAHYVSWKQMTTFN